MKNRGKKEIPAKYILIFLTVISSALIVLTLINSTVLAPVQNAVSYCITPVQKGMNRIGLWFYDKSQTIKEISKLRSENEELKAQIEQLEEDSLFTSQMKSELEGFRELYNLDNMYESYPKIAARVISANAGNWFSEFIIDKGSDDGLMVDMNVIAGTGLVGRITYVGKNYAKVSSIISDDHNVSAKPSEISANCIVSGDLTLMEQNLLRVSSMDKDAVVVEGDKLVTSYISDKYVPGLLIGYITQMTPDSNNMTQSGYLTPAVDFKNIEDVFVITQLKVTGEDD